MANLPEDVLNQVFESFVDHEHYTNKNWTQQLILLSVCQKWRHCALPLVCHNAKFEFKRPTKEDEDLESIEEDLDTNFDKIMAIGHPNLVRHLDIRIRHRRHVFECIMLVLDKQIRHLPVWKNLRSMRICLFDSRFNTSFTAEEIAANSSASNTIVDKMAKIMPNIVKLEFQDHTVNTCKILFESLANMYAPNLKTLIANHPIPLDDINMFSRLTNLHTRCEEGTFNILPLTYIDTLNCLNVNNIPTNMQWYNFEQSQSKKLVFSNLRKLNLFYSPVILGHTMSASTVETPELHFPKLQSLIINNTYEHQQLLSCIVLKSELEVLNITASISSLKLLTRIKLPSIKRLLLRACIIKITDSESLSRAFDVLCNVAKCAQKIDEMSLTITNSELFDLTECNVYPPLTSLSIRKIEHYAQVLCIVQHLPCLKKLSMHSVSTDNINLDEIEALLSKQQGVVPISTSVEEVEISYNRGFALNRASMLTTYLLVGMPALRKVYASRVDQDIPLEIIKKYKARYPHLENVKITDE